MNFRYTIWVAMLVLAATQAWAALDDARIVKDFEARAASYVDLEKQQAGEIKPTDSPAKLAEQKNQIGEKIRSARADAKQGDIFTPEIAAYFRRQFAATLAGHGGRKIRATLRHAEPVKDIPLQVNGKYPDNIPLQSTPPTLLLNLPHLPDKLQYRIVGHSLVLYDSNTELIVDYIDGVL